MTELVKELVRDVKEVKKNVYVLEIYKVHPSIYNSYEGDIFKLLTIRIFNNLNLLNEYKNRWIEIENNTSAPAPYTSNYRYLHYKIIEQKNMINDDNISLEMFNQNHSRYYLDSLRDLIVKD